MKAIKFSIVFSLVIVMVLMANFFSLPTVTDNSQVPTMTDAVPAPPTPIPTDNSTYPTPGPNDVTLPIIDMTKFTPYP